FKKYEIQSNPKDLTFADAMNRMGDCYFYARDFDNAIKSYNKSITASPSFGDYPLFQVGYVNGLQKKYTTKIMTMERLISEYPNSQYVDDAYYEIGRAYLMLESGDKAIASYRNLLAKFPNSTLAPKASLEIGMIYLNKRDMNNAIPAYQYVVEKYPGSEESRTALRSLETAYIENNNVSEYLDYAKSLGTTVQTNISAREDSITFIAVEKQYMSLNYKEAITGFTGYLSKYCEGGQYCTTARYYLADSYYQTEDYDNALTEFEKLAEIAGNKYMEEAVLRSAEISYDKKQFDKSLDYFGRLQEVAATTDNKNIGRLGVLRSSYFLNNHERTIEIANEIIDDAQINDETKLEARYNRAKAYVETEQYQNAVPDLKIVSENTRTKNGAESKYLLSQLYLDDNKLDDAEKEVLDFVQKNTTQQNQYWLARAFVVLSDIYIKRGDDFQAKQYLLSLQKNYTEQNEVQDMITERLEGINVREQQNIIN
ncbi:tetratricopeptide repeat protein, partial [Paludibacteraceae bacterium OttesenSCG-928-F17]|nr:tetratricopeptide repeat protein [Paludibacteraceae bacterium OttesenSCG-928-F17]